MASWRALEARLEGPTGPPRRVALPSGQAWIDPAPGRGEGGEAVLTLQQILFYRTLDFPLSGHPFR